MLGQINYIYHYIEEKRNSIKKKDGKAPMNNKESREKRKKMISKIMVLYEVEQY